VLESDTRLTETCVKPQKREVHIKSAFEFSHLEKFSKCWDQTQGSMKPTFNKHTQTQLMKRRRGGCQTRVLPTSARVASENQTPAEPRIGGSTQKKLES